MSEVQSRSEAQRSAPASGRSAPASEPIVGPASEPAIGPANEPARTESSAQAGEHESYDPHYFEPLAAIEDRHFWFRARNRVIAGLVGQLTAQLPAGYRVLEVGCGTGNVLRALEESCPRGVVMGMDLFAEGLSHARRRSSCALVQGDIGRPPFRTRFDVVGLFDVLEHLPDDVQVLRDVREMMKDDGALLLTVPAHQSLWSYFDEASRHCRRYEVEQLEERLLSAGFRVEYLTQYMASIFPIVWLGRRFAALMDRREAGDDARTRELAASELRITPVVNDVLALLLKQEARLITRRRRLPIGTSLLAIARKKSRS